MNIKDIAKDLNESYKTYNKEKEDKIIELENKLELAMKLIEDLAKRITYLENHQ